MNAETGWHPRVAVPVGERSRGADSLPVKEAYGYRPESWFRRYFGERR